MAKPKKILVIAGPNGAGKTTLATEFLANEADCPRFVNADLIAAGLDPFQPAAAAFRAGRLMIATIDEHAAKGERFAFETTLSGRSHARSIPRWREQGYRVKLVLLRLPTPDTAVARGRPRVSEGGHDVPESVIRRRFRSGWRDFERICRHLVVNGWSMITRDGSR